MTAREMLARIVLQEDVNFLLTNRIPRQLATRFMGWFSRIEQPLVRGASIAIWKLFADLDLSDAKHTRFRSLHDCFTRELKDGARPVDARPGILVSPCDAIVGACGPIDGVEPIQAKGFPYTLADLFGDGQSAERYRDGCYATLRLTSSMYHRFHAPDDGTVRQVTYISGDTWNVNPIALRRVERLFCKNERAAIEVTLERGGERVALVAVAAILVAGIRLNFLDVLLHLRYRGPNVLPCEARFARGQEMGWFEHGSTIIVFARNGFALCEGVAEGTPIRMGAALMRPAVTSLSPAVDSVVAMKCTTFRANLGLLLSGHLDGYEKATLTSHMERCPHCRSEYESRALLRSIISRSNVDERLPTAIEQAIESAKKDRGT